ncbi:MAG: hypothetical protein LBL24_07475 [Bacteroidales bacterium]|jgi:hypothetical protein|nr:hypothetical protein [Bacteroidales bacterium]
MKGFIFKCSFFMMMALATACAAADAFIPEGDTLSVLAAAPLAAAPLAAVAAGFDVSKLKCMSIDEFNRLKERCPRLYVIDVVIDADESYQFIVKRPDRSFLSAIADKKEDIDAANDLIIKNLLVGGDRDALNDGLVFAGFMKQVGEVMEQGRGFFAKA